MGFRGTGDVYNSSLTSLVDRLIGDAYPLVRRVAHNIQAVKYVAYNMQAIVTLALQAGSSGTLNGTQLLTLIQASLPTADPHVVGAWWKNGTSITISAG
jgi:hypothetical protein